MPRPKNTVTVDLPLQEVSPTPMPPGNITAQELANAFTAAMNAAKPREKKNIFNYQRVTPWTPTDGSPKLTLKRKMYQHGIPINENRVTNEEIQLLNKLRPGTYCDGFITVVRRRDKGLNIDYPFKTPAQRLQLVNSFGVRNLSELVQRCLTEAALQKKLDSDPSLDD